jgi:hypothetical protein
MAVQRADRSRAGSRGNATATGSVIERPLGLPLHRELKHFFADEMPGPSGQWDERIRRGDASREAVCQVGRFAAELDVFLAERG